MNTEVIFTSFLLAGTMLSFMFLLRARRLSAALYLTAASSRRSPAGRR